HRHPETLTDIGCRRLQAEEAMETQVDEESQQAPHLPVDALHLPQAGTELPVEPEHVVAVQVADELRDVRRNRLTRAHLVGTRHRLLVGIANHRVRWWP